MSAGKMMAMKQQSSIARSNKRLALVCAGLVVGVLVAIYGYAGSSALQGKASVLGENAAGPTKILDRQITVRLDANTGTGMDWQFKPVGKEVTVNVGARQTVYYRATNNTGQPITGFAVFSVTPTEANFYFKRVQCFCLTDQVVQAGQTIDLPVSFYIDPAFDADPMLKSATAITLSFTVYERRASRAGNTGPMPDSQRRLLTRNQSARGSFAPQQEHGEHG